MAPDLSIDVALAEKAPNFLITQATFEWYDLGDFSVLWQVTNKDTNQNSFVSESGGEWFGLETKGSLVVSEGKKMVTTIGLTDMIVVSTDNAVLVAPKSEAQKVKKIVEQFRAEKRTELL
jgi:mannose-1-phosphate guanylyltransferase